MITRIVLHSLFLAVGCFLFPLAGETNCQAFQLSDITLLDGSQVQATVTSVSDGQVVAEDGNTWALDGLRHIKLPNALLGSDPSTTRVQLRHGGVLFARDLSMENGVTSLETDVCNIQYDLFDLSCIYFREREAAQELESLLKDPSSETDRLLVNTSQGPRTVSGLVQSVSSDAVKIEYQGQLRSIDREKIIAMVPAQLDSGSSPIAIVTCIDRSRLLADTLTMTEGNWEVRWGNRATTLDASSIAQIEIRSDREVYVSDLDWELAEVQTSLAPSRSIQRDLNVLAQPMTLKVAGPEGSRIQTFAKGIGTQSRSRIAVRVPEGSQRLTGWVGIDVSANGHGDCICSILVDGIQVLNQQTSGREGATAIDLNLENAQQVEFLVEPGAELDLSDWVNWADLRFLK